VQEGSRLPPEYVCKYMKMSRIGVKFPNPCFNYNNSAGMQELVKQLFNLTRPLKFGQFLS
jgi:hypothetical protein